MSRTSRSLAPSVPLLTIAPAIGHHLSLRGIQDKAGMRMVGRPWRWTMGAMGIIAIAIGLALALWVARAIGPHGTVPPYGPVPPIQLGSEKIEGSLGQLMQEKLARGPEGARERVRVTIRLRGALSPDDRRALESAGADVELIAPWAVEALVPYGKLVDVAHLPFVEIIHLPFKPRKLS